MLSAMKEPAAQLRDIDGEVAHLYLQSLMDALVDKKRATHERSLNSVDYTADVYDELLTRTEIQEQIDSVNRFGFHSPPMPSGCSTVGILADAAERFEILEDIPNNIFFFLLLLCRRVLSASGAFQVSAALPDCLKHLIDANGRFSVLEKVALAVESRDIRRMMAALSHPLLNLQRIRPDHASAYLNFLVVEVASSAGSQSVK